MAVTMLEHVNIRTPDLEATRRFFIDVIGLEEGPRPNFAFPGAWLYCGGVPVVHLIGDGGRPPRQGSGAVDHVAFGAADYEGFVAKLSARGVPHQVRDVPGQRIRQVFVHDPNGVKVEINFRLDGG